MIAVIANVLHSLIVELLGSKSCILPNPLVITIDVLNLLSRYLLGSFFQPWTPIDAELIVHQDGKY